LKRQIEELVRWVKVKVPGAMIVTMDVVPRASDGGFFFRNKFSKLNIINN
jgi:hypothetical protein